MKLCVDCRYCIECVPTNASICIREKVGVNLVSDAEMFSYRRCDTERARRPAWFDLIGLLLSWGSPYRCGTQGQHFQPRVSPKPPNEGTSRKARG